MNRLQQKCFAGSIAMHVVLALALLIAPAFMSRQDDVLAVQPLDMIPANIIDDALAQPQSSPGPASAQPVREEAPTAVPRIDPAPPVIEPAPPVVQEKPLEKPPVQEKPTPRARQQEP